MFKTSDADRKRKADSNARVKERDPEAWRKRQRAYQDTWKAKHPETHSAGEHRRGLRKFGVTPEQYDEMFQSQNGKCAICGLESQKRLAVDHDHTTGAIRALLCAQCNMALGQLETDDRLERAVKYLARFRHE